MRYFVIGSLLLCLAVVSIAGFRGSMSRKPPLEVFPDMDRQPKLQPQTDNNFFPNQLSSRLPVPGTIARGSAYEDVPMNTGRLPGTTNFVELLPVPVTEALMMRGRERYGIYCMPCHAAAGDGKGITGKYGMVAMANFHDKRLVAMPDGEIFNTVTYGKTLMGAYGAQIPIQDRWAIVAYIRALQRSRLATTDDVPPNERLRLASAPPPATNAPPAGTPATNPPPVTPGAAPKK
ncbi:MAG TPA: cytochrome c [Verrucomicrobiae bacterium]|nr:cytochrome c [Verrucomicrobiae bacterium]